MYLPVCPDHPCGSGALRGLNAARLSRIRRAEWWEPPYPPIRAFTAALRDALIPHVGLSGVFGTGTFPSP
ncbi:Hypothetical protein NTJ_12920 [Nesidiocoris tenuis]|uniref:Uncharacterized protein n=1 Tax=Nesidiocoris tenuis TaxID=355587 RepID=A0ABN7B794_9HEMI|nr:Hypothetical protein NTJ_12920 [Nesidiocoris tenuis]